MIRPAERIFVACVFAAVTSAPAAQSRGELLYSTHCIACHTQQVHWREHKLVVDWASLDAQVRRWARNAGLSWTDNDVVEVARYLNALHYRFPVQSVTAAGTGDVPRGLARTK